MNILFEKKLIMENKRCNSRPFFFEVTYIYAPIDRISQRLSKSFLKHKWYAVLWFTFFYSTMYLGESPHFVLTDLPQSFPRDFLVSIYGTSISAL